MKTARPRAVFVVGPSSCGKTTTCDALARYYRIPASRHIKEVARTIMRTQGFSRKDVGTFDMQKAILDGQLNAERMAREDVDRNVTEDSSSPISFLSDRSALDPVVYAGMEETEAAASIEARLLLSEGLQQAIQFYRTSLFVLLPFVKEWVYDDGVRSLEEPERYSHRMQKMIERFNIPCVRISDSSRDLRVRIATVDTHLRKIMAENEIDCEKATVQNHNIYPTYNDYDALLD